MLLKELKDVTDIDGRIEALHKQLLNLYEQRSSITLPSVPPPTTIKRKRSKSKKEELQTLYASLSEKWSRYGIIVPEYIQLNDRLQEAVELRTILNTNAGTECYDIVLVPPSSQFNASNQSDFYKNQVPPQEMYFVSSDVPAAAPSITWDAMVVLTSPDAFNINSIDGFISSKSYIVCGINALDLGIREYLAMTLQIDKVFDLNRWTLLPKEWPQSGPVPCVRFINNRYRFEIDDVNGAFGDNSFRPAIILKDTE